MKNTNITTFTWIWQAANKTVMIEYNTAITTQANILKNIWTAGSFDNFKRWAKKNHINVNVFEGIHIA